MEVLYPHCAGLDVHKDTVVACARHMVNGTVTREIRTFRTTTKDLLALSEWLASQGCTHVAMEATGVYWKPVWHILSDGDVTLVLAHAAHVKNVPGRKTDVNDATWLADLLAHGLIRGSFVPDAQTQELRALLRTRKQFVRERSSHVQRLQKTLEDANIKLDGVISDIIGLSGRRMIQALIAGESDPEVLAALAHRRIKAAPEALREALRGRVTDHHRFLLQLHLQHIDALDAALSAIDREVGIHVEPFHTEVLLLTTIPGVNDLSAHVIRAEIGGDMSRFPSVGHLISWSGFCPRNDESAGKRRSNRMRKGAPWLKTTLIQCAWAATRKNGSYLQAQFQRLRARRQEGDRRRRRLDPHRRLPHAQGRHALSRSRSRSLRPPRQNRANQASPQPSGFVSF
jgi:transposase